MTFFWIENLNCMSKYAKEDEDLFSDAIVMVTRGMDSTTNEMV